MGAVVPENPYNTTGAVDTPGMFFGREQELVEIIERRIKHPKPISTILVGGRKVGKSSFLCEILRRIAKPPQTDLHLVPAYVNFQGMTDLGPSQIFTKIVSSLVFSLRKQSGIAVVFDPPSDEDPYAEFCGQLWAIWNQSCAALGNVRFVVLLDEADRLLKHNWTTDVIGNFRDLINTSELRFFVALVITGFRELHDYALVEAEGMGSVLGNAAYWTSLGVLTEDECRQLITEPLHGVLSEQVVQAVYDQSGGHPFVTQYLMQQIWSHDLASIAESDVENAAKGFSSQVKLFVSWETRFSDWETMVYCALAGLGGYARLDSLFERLASKGNIGELRDALDFLSYAGVVAQQDDRFWVAGRLFCDWFLWRHSDHTSDRSSIEHRLAVATENLLVIEEAESDHAEPKDVPLSLRLAKRRTERLVDELRMKLASISPPLHS